MKLLLKILTPFYNSLYCGTDFVVKSMRFLLSDEYLKKENNDIFSSDLAIKKFYLRSKIVRISNFILVTWVVYCFSVGLIFMKDDNYKDRIMIKNEKDMEKFEKKVYKYDFIYYSLYSLMKNDKIDKNIAYLYTNNEKEIIVINDFDKIIPFINRAIVYNCILMIMFLFSASIAFLYYHDFDIYIPSIINIITVKLRNFKYSIEENDNAMNKLKDIAYDVLYSRQGDSLHSIVSHQSFNVLLLSIAFPAITVIVLAELVSVWVLVSTENIDFLIKMFIIIVINGLYFITMFYHIVNKTDFDKIENIIIDIVEHKINSFTHKSYYKPKNSKVVIEAKAEDNIKITKKFEFPKIKLPKIKLHKFSNFLSKILIDSHILLFLIEIMSTIMVLYFSFSSIISMTDFNRYKYKENYESLCNKPIEEFTYQDYKKMPIVNYDETVFFSFPDMYIRIVYGLNIPILSNRPLYKELFGENYTIGIGNFLALFVSGLFSFILLVNFLCAYGSFKSFDYACNIRLNIGDNDTFISKLIQHFLVGPIVLYNHIILTVSIIFLTGFTVGLYETFDLVAPLKLLISISISSIILIFMIVLYYKIIYKFMELSLSNFVG